AKRAARAAPVAAPTAAAAAVCVVWLSPHLELPDLGEGPVPRDCGLCIARHVERAQRPVFDALSLEPQQCARDVLVRRHGDAAESAQPAPERLEHRLLARPRAEERQQPLAFRELHDVLILVGPEAHACNARQIAERADHLDVDAEATLRRERYEHVVAGVRDAEARAVIEEWLAE